MTHTTESSFLFWNQLVVFGNGSIGYMEKVVEALRTNDGGQGRGELYRFRLGSISGWISWSTSFVATEGPLDLVILEHDRVLELITLHVSLANVVATSTSVYGAILRLLVELADAKHKKLLVTGTDLRRMINAMNAQLVLLTMRRHELCEQEGNLFSQIQLAGGADEEQVAHRHAEAAVLHAVEGLEADRAERAASMLNVAAVAIAALTVYSAAKDVTDMVKPAEAPISALGHALSNLSEATWLLIGITSGLFLVIGVMWFLGRYR